MKRTTNRRKMMIAGAGVAAVAALSGAAVPQATEIKGVVSYAGGEFIPEGQVRIYLEDPAAGDGARGAETRVASLGKSRSLAFSLPLPAGSTAFATQEIVALLTREDGWLLARGSTPAGVGAPVEIELGIVMY